MPWSTELRGKRKKLTIKEKKKRIKDKKELRRRNAIRGSGYPALTRLETFTCHHLSSHGPGPQHPPWLCGCSAPLRSGAQGFAPHRQVVLHSPPQLAQLCFWIWIETGFFPFHKEKSLHPVPSGRTWPKASAHPWAVIQGWPQLCLPARPCCHLTSGGQVLVGEDIMFFPTVLEEGGN